MRKLSIKLIPLFVAATFLGALLCPKITRAALESSLKVEFEQEPLFFLDNFAPGQMVERWVKITSQDDLGRMVVARGLADDTGGLAEALEVVFILEGTELWRGKLSDFLVKDSLPLFFLNNAEEHLLLVTLTFSHQADNEFQSRTLTFDLALGWEAIDHIVISEVYYQVAPGRGWDSPSDRLNNLFTWEKPCLGNDTFPFWRDFWKRKFCQAVIRNQEWVELYNPTDERWEVGGWKLEDNSDYQTILSKAAIKPGGYLIITKDFTTRAFWPVAWRAHFSFLNRQIGDGLDNAGDHLFLKNEVGESIDAVGWGNDTAVWDPSPGSIPLGASLARINRDWDSDLAEDFSAQLSPSPGY